MPVGFVAGASARFRTASFAGKYGGRVDDLIAFLRARLDEDGAAAEAARAVCTEWYIACDDDSVTISALREHVGRHSPARALREVAAGRAILDEHGPGYPVTFPKPSGQPACGVCHAGGWDWEPEQWPCPTVRHLAAVWSGHSDYRTEWRPDAG